MTTTTNYYHLRAEAALSELTTRTMVVAIDVSAGKATDA